MDQGQGNVAYNNGYTHNNNRGRQSYNGNYRGNGHRMQHHNAHHQQQQQQQPQPVTSVQMPNNLPAQAYNANAAQVQWSGYSTQLAAGGMPVPLVAQFGAHSWQTAGPGAPMPHQGVGHFANPLSHPPIYYPNPQANPYLPVMNPYGHPVSNVSYVQSMNSTHPLLPPPPSSHHHQQPPLQQPQQQQPRYHHNQQQQQQQQQQQPQPQPPPPPPQQSVSHTTKRLVIVDPKTNEAIDLPNAKPVQPPPPPPPPQQTATQQQPIVQQHQQAGSKDEQQRHVQKNLLAQVRSAKDGKALPVAPAGNVQQQALTQSDSTVKEEPPVVEQTQQPESVATSVEENSKLDSNEQQQQQQSKPTDTASSSSGDYLVRPAPQPLRSQSLDAVGLTMHHSQSHGQLMTLAEGGGGVADNLGASVSAASSNSSDAATAGPVKNAPKYEFKPEKGESEKTTLERKNKYDREFLFKLQDSQLSTQRPSTLPSDIPELLRKSEVPRIQGGINFMPQYVVPSNSGTPKDKNKPGMFGRQQQQQQQQQQQISRGNNSRQQQHYQQPKQMVIEVRSREKVDLHHTDNAYVPGFMQKKSDDGDNNKRQDTERNIRSILNKVTPQNFESCFQQLTRCDIGTEDGLKCCVDIIFEKATRETSYSSVFAEICRNLAFLKVNIDKSGSGSFITHRSLLLKKCQNMFETPLLDQMNAKAEHWDDIIAKEEKEEKKKSLEEEKEEQVKKVKDQYYGNIRFIGELYMKDVLTANIIYSCINALLPNPSQKGDNRSTLVESLECLCELLRTVGKKLESNRKPSDANQIDNAFGRIKQIIADKTIESKVRFKLTDVVEMRGRNWELREMERRLQERPMTKEELEQKEREEEARRAMAASNIGGGGGGRGGHRGGYGRPPASPASALPPTASGTEWTPVVANSRRQQKMDTRKLILETPSSAGGLGGLSDSSSGAGIGGGGSAASSATPRLGPSRPKFSQQRGAGAAAAAAAKETAGDVGRSPAVQRLTGGGVGAGRRNNSRESSASREASPHTQQQQQPLPQSQLAKQTNSTAQQPTVKTVSNLTASASVGMHRSLSTHELPSRATASSNPAANILDKDALGRKSKNIMDEWLTSVISLEDTKSCFSEIASHPHLKVFVDVNAEHLLNANSKELRELGGRLFFELLHCQLIDYRTVIDGFSNLMENAEDMQSDFPLLGVYLGEIFSSFMQKPASYLDCVLSLVKQIPADIQCYSAGRKSPLRGEILSRAAHLASVRLGHERVGQDFRDAGVVWPDVLEVSAESAAEFVISKELQFTEAPLPDPATSAAPPIPLERLAGRVQEIVRAGLPEGDVDRLAESVIDLLERGVCRADRDSEAFNCELMRGVCGACLCANRLDAGLLKRLCPVLQQFVDGFAQEIWSLKAAATCLSGGPYVELLPEVFTVFLDNRLISEESFKNWHEEEADQSQREAVRTFMGTLAATASVRE